MLLRTALARHAVLHRLKLPAAAVATCGNERLEVRAPVRAMSSSEFDFVEQWTPAVFKRVGAALVVASAATGVFVGPLAGAAAAAVTAGYWRLGLRDIAQTKHSVLRNFPVLVRLQQRPLRSAFPAACAHGGLRSSRSVQPRWPVRGAGGQHAASPCCQEAQLSSPTLLAAQLLCATRAGPCSLLLGGAAPRDPAGAYVCCTRCYAASALSPHSPPPPRATRSTSSRATPTARRLTARTARSCTRARRVKMTSYLSARAATCTQVSVAQALLRAAGGLDGNAPAVPTSSRGLRVCGALDVAQRGERGVVARRHRRARLQAAVQRVAVERVSNELRRAVRERHPRPVARREEGRLLREHGRGECDGRAPHRWYYCRQYTRGAEVVARLVEADSHPPHQGGISSFHLAGGGDLVWNVGTGEGREGGALLQLVLSCSVDKAC